MSKSFPKCPNLNLITGFPNHPQHDFSDNASSEIMRDLHRVSVFGAQFSGINAMHRVCYEVHHKLCEGMATNKFKMWTMKRLRTALPQCTNSLARQRRNCNRTFSPSSSFIRRLQCISGVRNRGFPFSTIRLRLMNCTLVFKAFSD